MPIGSACDGFRPFGCGRLRGVPGGSNDPVLQRQSELSEYDGRIRRHGETFRLH